MDPLLSSLSTIFKRYGDPGKERASIWMKIATGSWAVESGPFPSAHHSSGASVDSARRHKQTNDDWMWSGAGKVRLITLDLALQPHSKCELQQAIENAPRIVTDREEATAALSQSLVAKKVADFNAHDRCYDEVFALEHAKKIGVNVPSVYRIVKGTDSLYYIIMERIQGKTLEQLWSSIGWFRTLLYSWQLRKIVKRMRESVSVRGGGLASGRYFSPHLEGMNPLVRHISPTHLAEHLNWWLVSCRPTTLTPRHDLVLRPLEHHVFTHQDLAPRNIIVDPQNRLWIVDWGYAGYFPIYVEYTGMHHHAMDWVNGPSFKARLARWRWFFLRWIVAGSYSTEARAMFEISRRSTRFKAGSKPPHTDRALERSVVPVDSRWELGFQD
ncbi:15656_t:CDS:2 [Acaulospora colombiana]|uniref:15656_t:CDS:1 n=1 Tax=Acaulospora colombiana TaxID=27376 RepID=A0ACA9MD68_9GLOM|nr:15656_t:CDS:2 [Acaulospora colombiana]